MKQLHIFSTSDSHLRTMISVSISLGAQIVSMNNSYNHDPEDLHNILDYAIGRVSGECDSILIYDRGEIANIDKLESLAEQHNLSLLYILQPNLSTKVADIYLATTVSS